MTNHTSVRKCVSFNEWYVKSRSREAPVLACINAERLKQESVNRGSSIAQ